MTEIYRPTIGLEIHAELKTRTKMFCDSKNDSDEKRPNVNICPICMAHPGTLPTINKKAVEYVIKVGLALGGEIADFSEFDRKNYFYPDIPKGYQISQYKHPIVSGGELNGIKITRVHLEEDTAVSIHDRGDYSLIDFNRAGVPLMELVTDPVIHSAEEAGNFAREFQVLLRYLGVAEANMEKGQMRVEANISVSPDAKMGTKVEVKNLNSFKSVERAIKYEIDRMTNLLEKGRGGEIVQETRGWNEAKQETFSQRFKESSHDYRYFPEPDLPKMRLRSAFDLEKMKKELPELPEQKRKRYKKMFGIDDEYIEIFVQNSIIFDNIRIGNYFEEIVKFHENDKNYIKLVANYLISGLLGQVKTTNIINNLPSPRDFSEIVELVIEGSTSSTVAKMILGNRTVGLDSDITPRELVKREGLFQKSDEGEIKKIAEKVIAENQKVVADYRAGKETSLKFLIGQLMKETKGSANPQVAEKVLIEMLK